MKTGEKGKERIDLYLVSKGFFASREKAQAAIMAGLVYVGERKVSKPSETVEAEAPVSVRNSGKTFVSRGALKLKKAVEVFQADLKDKTVMDIGASTGGFTEICLQQGAKHVYSIDVGYGQLDWKLRNDPRVTVMERTNARYLQSDMFPERPQITVMDVSFISIRLILPVAAQIMGEEGIFYTLIKPQFEAGRDKIGKNGVVRDPEVHREVLTNIVDFCRGTGWCVTKLDFSPIKGPEGNIEFLAEIRNSACAVKETDSRDAEQVIADAHAALDKEK